jgi:hypothetical protein
MKNAATSISPILLCAFACTSSTTSSPAPPSDLSIVSIHVAGTAESNTWLAQSPIPLQVGCNSNPVIVEISPAPEPPYSINSTINGFQIAVPGSCVSLQSCGWFVLRVDSGQDDSIAVPTSTTPITVNDAINVGTHTVSIELHDAYDQLLLGSDNTPIGEQVSVEFVASDSCSATDADAG